MGRCDGSTWQADKEPNKNMMSSYWLFHCLLNNEKKPKVIRKVFTSLGMQVDRVNTHNGAWALSF